MTKAQESVPPRQRLLLATLRCIERHGVAAATVRRITEDAGVNVAAVNYYFGNKDRLVEAALASALPERLAKALEELEALLWSGSWRRARDAVEAFFRSYLRQALDAPRIGVACLGDALLTQDYQTPGPREIREFVARFTALVGPHMPQATEADRRRAVMHVWATVIQLALLPDLFGVPREELNGEAMAAELTATLFGS